MTQATMSHHLRLFWAGVATTAVVLASIFLLSTSSGESFAEPADGSPSAAVSPR